MVAVLVLLLLFVLGLWIRETRIHRRALRAIPIRVHVNGSRGKSSVVRLIAAAMREGGVRTVAKTTGSKARFIHADGNETPVIRLGTPNICEQIGILEKARREQAQAIVMECMAVRPDLQKICEEHIMRSTIGVITNVRPDHLDVMGPTVADVAVALSSTVPRGGTTVIGDARYTIQMQRVADERGSNLLVAKPEDVPDGAMEGFAYFEHEENVATALQVTRSLGIDDGVALRGMYKAIPDIGACTFWQLPHRGRVIEFVNIFAANDLESTITIWQRLGLGNPGEVPTFALINLRGDRVDRSLQYAEAVEIGLRADTYVLVGGIPESVQRRFEKAVPTGRLVVIGAAKPAEVFDRIAELIPDRARVGGIGNIGGIGHEILAFVTKHGGASC
jgi:poly-gamma-glutamate synthase PgsB/CapB